jgi:hypothetical protein
MGHDTEWRIVKSVHYIDLCFWQWQGESFSGSQREKVAPTSVSAEPSPQHLRICGVAPIEIPPPLPTTMITHKSMVYSYCSLPSIYHSSEVFTCHCMTRVVRPSQHWATQLKFRIKPQQRKAIVGVRILRVVEARGLLQNIRSPESSHQTRHACYLGNKADRPSTPYCSSFVQPPCNHHH